MNKTPVAQQAKTASLLPPTQGILQRKCACGTHTMGGGQCADCAKNKNGLQRKLAIGASNDPLEQEADRVADQVMATPAHFAVSGTPPHIQRFTGQASASKGTAPDSVDDVLAGSGRPLDPALRQDMEQRFGHDFSLVRVHSGAAAEQSAQDVQARAYTVGDNVVFGADRFAPGTYEGRRLIAHELTHVVQQSGADGNSIRQNNENCGGSAISQPVAEGRAVAGSVQRQPAPPAEIEMPAEWAFAADERKRTWRKYARSLGRKDAARIRKSGRLSTEDRQEVNAKLGFFEGEAREIYEHEIKPALKQVTGPQPENIEFAPEYADPRKSKDKKFALRRGQEDAALIRKNGKVSQDFRLELNATARLFEGEAKEAYIQEIKTAMAHIIPSLTELQDFSRNAINDVWGAQNQGLDDFEAQLASPIDWVAFALTVLGNVAWAAAAFTAPAAVVSGYVVLGDVFGKAVVSGRTVFLSSLGGIGVSTAGSIAATVKDRPSFHTEARKKIDALKGYLDSRIDEVTRQVREQDLANGWDGSRTREELLNRLVKPNYMKVVTGGVPVIDLPAVAGSVETELLFRAATTPWEDWAGWKKGNAWLDFNYTIDNVSEGLFKSTAPSQWSKPKTEWIYIFPLGNEELPNLNDSLNNLHDNVLHQPKDTRLWPIRKTVSVLLRGAGKVHIGFGADSSFQGWSTDVDDRYINGWLQLAGMEGASKAMFPELLLKHLWPESGGKPPVIEKLFIGS